MIAKQCSNHTTHLKSSLLVLFFPAFQNLTFTEGTYNSKAVNHSYSVKMATENMHNSLNDFRESMEALLQSICGPKLYNDVKIFASNHPFMFSAAFAICVFSAVPLLFFLGFAVITLFIALICFLCIEGSIIAIGGIIFIGIVCFISIIVVTLISAVAVAYWIIQYIQSMFSCKQILCINSNVKKPPNDEDKID